MLVVVEGMDGAGKSTLLKNLSVELPKAGFTTHVFREPGSTPMGEELREILKGPLPRLDITDLLLMTASRLELLEQIKSIPENEIVLLDRYKYSTIVYQHETLRDYPLIGTALINLPRNPDLLIMLDISIEESLKRNKRKKTTDVYEIKPVAHIWNNYQYIMDELETKLPLKRIDAVQSEKLVTKEAMESIIDEYYRKYGI